MRSTWSAGERSEGERLVLTLPYLYPDGPVAVEAVRVIGSAMVELGLLG